jgi:hypothetical protein
MSQLQVIESPPFLSGPDCNTDCIHSPRFTTSSWTWVLATSALWLQEWVN